MGHAILSPSASGRWITCPASVRMCRDLPEQEQSVYAEEGTQFHTLCEIVASNRLLESEPGEYAADYLDWALATKDEWQPDQLEYVEDFVKLIRGFLDEEEGATLLLEKVVDSGVPGCWGTADVVIIYSNRIRVIDIKYGAGVRVSAIGNSQLRLYGAGGLSLVEDPLTIHEVTTTIWQPRMNNLSEETLTRKELLAWRDSLIPIAKLALGEDAPFGPSESACRWCPVSGTCAARTRWMLNQDYGNPEFLSGEEMAEAYSRVDHLKQWAKDIEDAALKMAYEESGSVPGYKVVRSGGRRGIVDDDKAVELLLAAGYYEYQVSVRKPATLGKLDKTVGAEELQRILGDVLVKSEGRLSLVPESDNRPEADAFHDAKRDFAEIQEGEA